MLVAGCSLIVATPSSHPLIFTDSDNGKSLTLAPGDKIEVSLAAVSGTGYVWEIQSNNPSVLRPLGLSDFEMPKMAAPGAMGAQVFHFQADSPGTAKLAMIYTRPWETNVAPARTFAITVTVKQ
jgi:inhibitor of cysteine peptidase